MDINRLAFKRSLASCLVTISFESQTRFSRNNADLVSMSAKFAGIKLNSKTPRYWCSFFQCCDRQSIGEGNLDESTYGALSCPVTPNSGPGPPPTYDSLIFDSRSLPNFIDKKPEGAETPGIIIPSMVSTLLNLSTTVRSTECNEATEQEISDEGLPSYEAALKLDANGYV